MARISAAVFNQRFFALSLFLIAGLLVSCSKTPTSAGINVPPPSSNNTVPTFERSWYCYGPETLAPFKDELVVTKEDSVNLFKLDDLSTVFQSWDNYGGYPFYTLYAAAVSPTTGHIFAVDYDEYEVYQFTNRGVTVNYSNYGFEEPQDVATDSRGYYYVADSDNSQVEKFDAQNNLIEVWYSFGSATLDYPTGVALDAHDNLYIADWEGYIYELAAGTQNLLNTWNLPSHDYVYQMAIDKAGVVYAPLYETNKEVAEYKAGSATPFLTWDGTQGGGTKFAGPDGICIIPNGDILVSDYDNDNIQEFKPQTSKF